MEIYDRSNPGWQGEPFNNQFMEKEFHIGSVIRKVSDEKRIGPTELGKKIKTSKQNVYGIFRRKSVDTELLWKLSEALQYDFFMEYVRTVNITQHVGFNNWGLPNGEDNTLLHNEIKHLKEENELLKKMVRILESQKKE